MIYNIYDRYVHLNRPETGENMKQKTAKTEKRSGAGNSRDRRAQIAPVAVCLAALIIVLPFSGCISPGSSPGGIALIPQTNNSSLLSKIVDAFSGNDSDDQGISGNISGSPGNEGNAGGKSGSSGGKSGNSDGKAGNADGKAGKTAGNTDSDAKYDSRVIVSDLPEGFTYTGKLGLTMDDVHRLIPETKGIDAEISAAGYAYKDGDDSGNLYFAAVDLGSGFVVNAGLYMLERKMTENGMAFRKELIGNTVIYSVTLSKSDDGEDDPDEDVSDGSDILPADLPENLFAGGLDKKLNLKIWPNGDALFITMTTMENESAVYAFAVSSGTIR